MAYEEMQGDMMDVQDHPDHNFKDQIALNGNVMDHVPPISIEEMGRNMYRFETRRDSVTGKLRTPEEAKGLSTTRTNK
jgi:hypothetical protein